MKYLLDTHALLWWLFDDRRLSRRARGLIGDRGNDIVVSAVSSWEIATKHRLGRLPSADVLVQDISGWLMRAGFSELSMTVAHAQRAGTWQQPHRDPFDRMLAAQSVLEGAPLVTNDKVIQTFGIAVVW